MVASQLLSRIIPPNISLKGPRPTTTRQLDPSSSRQRKAWSSEFPWCARAAWKVWLESAEIVSLEIGKKKVHVWNSVLPGVLLHGYMFLEICYTLSHVFWNVTKSITSRVLSLMKYDPTRARRSEGEGDMLYSPDLRKVLFPKTKIAECPWFRLPNGIFSLLKK